jgi:hypothetical protein
MHAADSPCCDGNSTWVSSALDKEPSRFHSEGDAGGVRAITTCCYYKSVVYYSRDMADSCRRSMLFSSGDYPGTLSSILSGEGLDEREQG